MGRRRGGDSKAKAGGPPQPPAPPQTPATPRFRVGIACHQDLSGPGHGPLIDHPESPERVAAVLRRLRTNRSLWSLLKKVAQRHATDEELQLCHDEAHVMGLQELARISATEQKPHFVPRCGPVCMAGPCREIRQSTSDSDTFVTAGSLDTARSAVGGVLQLVDLAMCEDGPACGLALCRPPGHHASRNRSSGFCLFNNVAIAAAYSRANFPDVKRVLIFDWDVHHGQGTQQIFEQSSEVLVINVHRHDGQKFYPATGSVGEVGLGSGRGYSINVALPEGYGGAALWTACSKVLLPAARRFSPHFIFVSAGFDAAAGDPIGGCCVAPKVFGAMASELQRLSLELCHGRLIFVLEGGYDPEVLADCVEEVVTSLAVHRDTFENDLGEPFALAPVLLEGKPCNGAIRRTCEVHHNLPLRLPLPSSKKSDRRRTLSPATTSAVELPPTELSRPNDVRSSHILNLEEADLRQVTARLESFLNEVVVRIAPMACPRDVLVSAQELWVWHGDHAFNLEDTLTTITESAPSNLRRWRFKEANLEQSGMLRCAEYRSRKKELTVRLRLDVATGRPIMLEPVLV